MRLLIVFTYAAFFVKDRDKFLMATDNLSQYDRTLICMSICICHTFKNGRTESKNVYNSIKLDAQKPLNYLIILLFA